MARIYDGQWLDLVILPGGIDSPGPSREIMGSMPLHTGAYTINHPDGSRDNVIDAWNSNKIWEANWARRADQIHTAFMSRDKAMVNNLIEVTRDESPGFANTKRVAFAAYEKWAD